MNKLILILIEFFQIYCVFHILFPNPVYFKIKFSMSVDMYGQCISLHNTHPQHLPTLSAPGLVMKKLKTSEEDDEMGSINSQLEELTPQLREKAITFKKTSSNA